MFIDSLLAGVIASGLTLFVDHIFNPKINIPASNFYVDMYHCDSDNLNDILSSCMDIKDEREKKQKGPSDEQV